MHALQNRHWVECVVVMLLLLTTAIYLGVNKLNEPMRTDVRSEPNRNMRKFKGKAIAVHNSAYRANAFFFSS